MYQVSQWICICYLCGLSIIDIYKRMLPSFWLAAGVVVAVFYQIVWREQAVWMIAAGAAAGGIFLVISRITAEALGYGDSLLILALGIYLGIWNLLCTLMASFSLAAVFALIVLVKKRFKQKAAFPFVPFLTAGYIITILAGGV